MFGKKKNPSCECPSCVPVTAVYSGTFSPPEGFDCHFYLDKGEVKALVNYSGLKWATQRTIDHVRDQALSYLFDSFRRKGHEILGQSCHVVVIEHKSIAIEIRPFVDDLPGEKALFPTTGQNISRGLAVGVHTSPRRDGSMGWCMAFTDEASAIAFATKVIP